MKTETLDKMIDEQIKLWMSSLSSAIPHRIQAKHAMRSLADKLLNREPSEAMVLAVLPENESEMGHLMALTCTKVYLAMRAAEKEELGVK